MTTASQIKQIQDILFTKLIDSGLCPKIDMAELVEQCGLCDEDMEKMKNKKKSSVSPEVRCMARTWGGGMGTQCSYKRKEGQEFCGQHLKNGWEKHGRIDQDIPNIFKKPHTTKQKVSKNGPKKNLSAYMFFRKEKTKEYQINYPTIKKQSELTKLMSTDWNKMTTEDKLPFKEMEDADKKRYAEELKIFNNNGNVIAESINHENNQCINLDGIVKNGAVKNENIQEKEEEEEEEEQEVSVVPYKYKGSEYLLDVDTGKVYNTDLDFVGKKVGNTIDFDAENSSDEEE